VIRLIAKLLGWSREDGESTTNEFVRLYMRIQDGDQCRICKRMYSPLLARVAPLFYFSRIEIDHIIPYSLGGRNDVDNYQLLCRECNRSKGAKLEHD
jgi:5-methylcytosine-specific restriction endonuclease McrA